MAVQNIVVKQQYGGNDYRCDVYAGNDTGNPDTVTYNHPVATVIIHERFRANMSASEKTEFGTLLMSDLVSAAFGASTV